MNQPDKPLFSLARKCFTVLLLFIHLICLGACGSGSDAPPTEQKRVYTQAGTPLTISIAEDLDVTQSDIEEIFYFALQVSHCRRSDGSPVPISLAEACILYNDYYLFPDHFPNNLDTINDGESYVSFLNSQDRFTYYYSPDAYAATLSYREGESAYIGFRYGCDGDQITDQTPLLIEEVFPFSRAWIDGLQAGDRITAIDGIPVNGLTVDAALDRIPRQEASSVVLTIRRNDVETTISTGPEENIALFLSPGILYISVRSFTINTGVYVQADVEALLRQASVPVTGIILDLRDNPGGSVSGALQLIDYLIDRDTPADTNPIMTYDGTVYHNQSRYLGNYSANRIGPYDQTNFVLLVDSGSASASEITAAALQYYDTATLIGTRTFGKGVSQFVFELVDGAGVWITSHYIYAPDHTSFHETGVAPDYTVSAQPASFSEDPVLDQALLFLQTGEVQPTAGAALSRSRTTAGPYRGDPYINRFINRGKFWK